MYHACGRSCRGIENENCCTAQAGACGREGKSIDLALVGEELHHMEAQICLEQCNLLEVCIVLDDWLKVHRQRQDSR